MFQVKSGFTIRSLILSLPRSLARRSLRQHKGERRRQVSLFVSKSQILCGENFCIMDFHRFSEQFCRIGFKEGVEGDSISSHQDYPFRGKSIAEGFSSASRSPKAAFYFNSNGYLISGEDEINLFVSFAPVKEFVAS